MRCIERPPYHNDSTPCRSACPIRSPRLNSRSFIMWQHVFALTRPLVPLRISYFSFVNMHIQVHGSSAWILKMQVKLPGHPREPPLCAAYTIWSHASQQCFEVYLHCDLLPGALSFPLRLPPSSLLHPPPPLCLLHSLSLYLSLPFLSPHLSSSSFLHFRFAIHPFSPSFHSLSASEPKKWT